MSVVEINGHYFLRLERGFLKLESKDEKEYKVPLDSITTLVVTGNRVSYSHSLLCKFLELGIPVIFCSKNFSPVGILTSLVSNSRQTEIVGLQVEASKPFCKNLWKSIVYEKVKKQKSVLEITGQKYFDFDYLLKDIKSGDTTNIEAQAAKKYFVRIFGDDFKRDRKLPGTNSFLNFGYMVLRACVARFVIASGLNPALGIHHRNKLNPFCLVDDLMEPFRPYVDIRVHRLIQKYDELNTESKKKLTDVLFDPVPTLKGVSPLKNIIQKTVWSFIESLKTKSNELVFNEEDVCLKL